jgi:hypothetical protein
MHKRIPLSLTLLLILPIFGGKLTDFSCHENGDLNKDLPFCLDTDYNKEILPVSNNSMNVSVLVHLIDVTEVNDSEETITLIMLLAVSWIDPRLKLNTSSSAWISAGEQSKYSSMDWLNYIWKPDLDMLNVKRFKVREIIESQGSLTLYSNKRFWYEIPVEVTLGCPKFDFRKYPFDEQTCSVCLGSFQYDVTKNRYIGKVEYERIHQRILQYEVTEIKALSYEEGLVNYKEYFISEDGGMEYQNATYSHFAVKMTFTRLIRPHLMEVYLPSLLLVFSSWLGFLIEPSSVPGRISLSVTLLLCLITMR